jgi:hypothetical protein
VTAIQEPPVAPPKAEPRAPGGARRPGGGWLIVGIALIFIGVGILVVSTAYDEEPEARALGPNLPVNEGASVATDLRANNSPKLVQSPVDANNLVVANRVDSPEYSCGLSVSFDGGGRWAQTPIPAPADASAGRKCFAPDVAFAADGTLFLSYVTLKGRENAPEAVWISRSGDGGKTLDSPVRTPLPPHSFGVRLTTDPRAADRVHLTWLEADELGLYQFSGTGNPIQTIRSDDGGVNWTDPVRVSSPARERVVAPAPVAGANPDELFVLYLDLGDDALDYAGGHRGQGGAPYPGTWELVLARSTDRGGTWEESVVDDEIVPTERFIVFTPPVPSLAVDREDGTLYAAFQDGRAGDADVLLWRLEPGAGEWSAPVRVNDTPREDGTSQYRPEVAVAPDGRVDVLYYDRRADRSDVLNEVSFQSSDDGGASFGERIRLSDRAFSSRIGAGLERDLADLGSRLGLLSTETRAFAVWTDTRAGSRETAKQDVARGIVAFSDPPRLSDAAELAMRIGGIALIVLGIVVALVLGGRRRRPAPA